jgi:hypothetical protein
MSRTAEVSMRVNDPKRGSVLSPFGGLGCSVPEVGVDNAAVLEDVGVELLGGI